MVRVGCLECGRPPPRDLVGSSKRIQAIVGDNNEHLKVLFHAGLIGDRHLAIFLEWPPSEQKAFMDSLDTGAFVKAILARRLISQEDSSVGCASSNQRTECGGIPEKDVGQGPAPEPSPPPLGVLQPSQEDEEAMTNPAEPDDMLFRALCLEGPLPAARKLFGELVVCEL